MWPNILAFLRSAAASEQTAPEDRFWALDGLAFSAAKHGEWGQVVDHIEAMGVLLAQGGFGADERLAYSMKRMHVLARKRKVKELRETAAEAIRELPDKPGHLRIFRYNFAHALFTLKLYEAVIVEADALIKEYYDVIGIGPEDVMEECQQDQAVA